MVTKIRGLQIRDAFFGAGLARNGSDGNIMDIQVDDSTIEINADALRIKDDGVTNAKLANMTQGTVKVGGASDAPTDLDASTDGYILIGDGTDVNSVAVSGDVTITNAGAVTIGNDKVDNDKLANMTQGTVKVGGASDAPTDLDASADGYILIGDGTDVNSVAVSGDITITNAGVTAIGTEKVVESMLDIDNAPTDGYFLKWSTANGMEWADVDVSAVSDTDIKFEDETTNVNGSRTAFTISSTPVTNSVQVTLNGLLQQPGAGKDYELSGTTITFATAPEVDDILLVHYIAASA